MGKGKANRAILALAIVMAVLAAGCPGDDPVATTITAEDQKELSTLTGQIADPARSPQTRIEAATLLLDQPYPGAHDALRTFLADQSNPSARIAVAEAIAGYDGPRAPFLDELVAMLSDSTPSVRTAGARALGTGKDPSATDSLIKVAEDTHAEQATRLAAISGLQYTLRRQAIEALVDLTEDSDPSIQSAAVGSLEALTYASLGDDPAAWQQWWATQRRIDWSEWLAEWATNLNRRYRKLKGENAALRARLAQALRDVYAAGSETQREAMLADAVADPLPEVRLAALDLIKRRVAADETVSPALRTAIRRLLSDPDGRIRRSAVLLLASLRDEESVDVLLTRLEAEQTPTVRQAILSALGLLGDQRAIPAIIVAIDGEQGIAAAAAGALATMAEKTPLDEKSKAEAAAALLRRYTRASQGGADNGLTLREALLRAMGYAGDGKIVPVLAEALADPAATVRLAAVNALARRGDPNAAESIEPLLADEDRGVRQAAITALGTLGGPARLEAILLRTDPGTETDSAVREQAWGMVMQLLAEADADVLENIAERLQGRPDVAGHRIKILEMLVARQAGEEGDKVAWASAKRTLGLALLDVARPAEAAPHLAEAYEALTEAQSPEATSVWIEWLEALLSADDPSVIAMIGAQDDGGAFDASIVLLEDHLQELLETDEGLSAAIMLASEALKQMPDRLSFAQREIISKLLAEATDRQLAANRRQVSLLVGQLTAGDESASKAAEQLQAMGEQAVRPLVEELLKAISSESPDTQLEKAIIDLLGQVAPALTGYDLTATAEERRKLVQSWLDQL